MASILSQYMAVNHDDVTARILSMTHVAPGCGYVRAWVDLVNPLLIWYLPVCPADAVIASLAAAIPAFVTQRISDTAITYDPFERVQAIINLVIDDSYAWIDANTYTHLAAFLKGLGILRPFILQEMTKQGIVS